MWALAYLKTLPKVPRSNLKQMTTTETSTLEKKMRRRQSKIEDFSKEIKTHEEQTGTTTFGFSAIRC
jgi:hypothetical protein